MEPNPYHVRVKDFPARQRPREMFERLGAENLSDAALLAIILRSGAVGSNVMELSDQLLRTYGSLTNLARASVDDLLSQKELKGLGPVKAQVIKASLELARRMSEEGLETLPTITTPDDAARVLREEARGLDHERFWTLLLDSKNRLKKRPILVTKGLVNASLVHAREVFRDAISSSSVSVVLAHNHPSGDPSPSSEDIKITRELVQAGKVVDIQVLDHIIIGRKTSVEDAGYISLRESGLVAFEN